VDVAQPALVERGGMLLEGPEAEILEHRNGVRKRDDLGEAVGVEPQPFRPILVLAVEPGVALGGAVEGADAQDVLRRLRGRNGDPIGLGKVVEIGQSEAGGALRADQLAERLLDRRLPAADHLVEAAVERGDVGGRGLGSDVERVAKEGEVAVAELDRPVGDVALRGLLDHLADGEAAARGQLVTGQPDEGEHVALEDRADEGERRPGPVGERHGGRDELSHRLDAEADQEVVRQGGDGVAKRLAAMAGRIEAELALELLEPPAKQRHFLDRGAQRLAGPQAGMDSDADDLAAFPDGHDDEVERHPAVDRGPALGLGEERDVAASLEIAHRTERSAGVGRLAGDPEQAERVGGLAVGPLDLIAEQGHRAVGEPAQQGRAFLVAGLVGIGAHPCLHRPPVGDGGADVGEDPVEIGDDLAAAARVGAVDLEIHHRFAALGLVTERLDQEQGTALVAGDAEDGMEQPVDGEVARGERIGDAVDQEGHVVVDDPDPHPAMAERAALRLDPDKGDPGRAAEGAGRDELGGGDPVRIGELGELAGKGAVDESMGEGVDDLHVGGGGLRRRVAGAASRGSGFGSSDIVRGHIELRKGRRAAPSEQSRALCPRWHGGATPWGGLALRGSKR